MQPPRSPFSLGSPPPTLPAAPRYAVGHAQRSPPGNPGRSATQLIGLSVPSPEKGVKAIAAGRHFSLALLTNGTVMAWGENTFGQLGDGTTVSSDAPVAVAGLSGVTAIAAGAEFSLALLSNGTVMAWGLNEHGRLGDGTITGPETCNSSLPCSTTPVPVSGLSGVPA